MLLLLGLGLHVLYLDGIRLLAVHVELVVAHAQVQGTLADVQAGWSRV